MMTFKCEICQRPLDSTMTDFVWCGSQKSMYVGRQRFCCVKCYPEFRELVAFEGESHVTVEAFQENLDEYIKSGRNALAGFERQETEIREARSET